MSRVAITGFGVVSPIGVGVEQYWRALAEGRSGIARITRFDCSSFSVQLAGEVKDMPALPPDVAAAADDDPKVGFAHVACVQALADARISRLGPRSLLHLGTGLESFNLTSVECRCGEDFIRSLAKGGKALQMPLDAALRLVCAHLGRPGALLTNCSACAASAQAVGHGFRSIRSGRCEVAVCGGFDSMINPLGVGGFQMLGALTADNERGPSACRPFDASRSGAVLGEGAAVVVLEPLEAARAAGKRVLAEVCGYGSTLDAYSLSAPDPDGDGAARAMLAALDDAGIAPDAVGHINAHGTGTLLNDRVEATAIRRVFDGRWERIPVSATKSVTGHLIGAAGALEVGACLLALTKGIIPHNPWLRNVGGGCELAHVTGAPAAFEGEYVLTNSFGFGGQNAALVLRKSDGQ
jgi:3-oxoacyl-[acyl-carrier-protein] synthase II